MADKQYVYAVARIRSKELSLLSGAFLEQLTAAKDYDECINFLEINYNKKYTKQQKDMMYLVFEKLDKKTLSKH